LAYFKITFTMIDLSSGFLLINKKSGPTSHDIVDALRKITGLKKIGHAGTLDPFATGVLLIAIGRQATKKIDLFVKKNKTYTADIILGFVSDTFDRDGIKIKKENFKIPDNKNIDAVLKEFVGEQEQIPPMFSAKKVGGKKLYELARKGIEIERKASIINIYSIENKNYSWPKLKIKVTCSTGTYIRSLANDIGVKLGCGAYLEELERTSIETSIEKFDIKNAHTLEDINKNNWKNFLFQI